MKVLLIQAYLGGNEAPVFPLGLACIAASIPDHTTQLFDPNTVSDPFTALEKQCRKYTPDIVGISLRNIDSTNKSKIVFYYKWLKKLLTVTRSACPARIIVGGSGFSMFAREIMEQEPLIDYGIYLEGENTFPQLLNNLDTPHMVPSVFYRCDNKILFNDQKTPVDINTTFVPAWNLLPLSPYKKGKDAIGVETKRGCSLGCIYCIYGFLNGKQYRLKSPERVVNEIQILSEEHKLAQFTFVDSIFNVPLSHAKAICHEMIGRNLHINWSAWFNEHFMSPEFIALLSKAGCTHVIFSPDAFANSTLQKLGKNLSTKDIIHSLKLLREKNTIEVSYNFFRNPPGQSLGNFCGMIFFYFYAKLLLKKRVHFEFSTLRIEPHTELHRMALQESVVTETEDLLEPKYYNNKKTRYLERPFSFLLSLLGK